MKRKSFLANRIKKIKYREYSQKVELKYQDNVREKDQKEIQFWVIERTFRKNGDHGEEKQNQYFPELKDVISLKMFAEYPALQMPKDLCSKSSLHQEQRIPKCF